MRKVRDVFDEWAESGKDLGMETGHADAVEEMLEFSLKERFFYYSHFCHVF